MRYISHYDSPLGPILLAADEEGLTGLWFEGQKYDGRGLAPDHAERDLPVFHEAGEWLDLYFSGREPDFFPPLHMTGTPFQREVWTLLRHIPYGETSTYGAIAGEMGRRTSARAAAGAVARNPISILIPCHRVVGADGSLTGYAGGIKRKIKLLTLEGAAPERFYAPKKGTAL